MVRVLVLATLTVCIDGLAFALLQHGLDWDGWTNRAGLAEVLREGLAGLNGGERAGRAAIVRERLDVDRAGTVVLDDSLLGRGAGGDEGSAHDGSEELHVCGLVGACRMSVSVYRDSSE